MKKQIIELLSKTLSKELAEHNADLIGGIFDNFMINQRKWYSKNTSEMDSHGVIMATVDGIIKKIEIDFETK